MEKIDYYEKYNDSRYVHYRQVRVGGAKVQEITTEKGTRKRINPKMEKRVIPFKEIKSLRLDDYGTTLPQLDTEDYTVVANYLLDYWGAIIGDAVTVYIHLKRYAYGKKDFCFPDIEVIALKMNKSVNTIKKYIDILEEHHFIAKFNRYDVTDKNREVSPFFKIRRQIPLITPEMYQSLHPKLKELHDGFMEEYRIEELTNELTEHISVVDEMAVGREIIANKETRKKIQSIIIEHNNFEYIMNNLDKDNVNYNVLIKKSIEEKLSKPSYETWIKQSVVFINIKDDWIIAFTNDIVKDWIEEKYEKLFLEILSKNLDVIDPRIEYHNMEYIIEKLNTVPHIFKKDRA